MTPTVILPYLPSTVAAIPAEPEPWRLWRDRISRVRAELHTAAARDREKQEELRDAVRHDPLLFMTLFGVHFEPRDRTGRPKGWYPSIPMPFQAVLVRWIEQVLSVTPDSPEGQLGRGDGVLEKARGMTGTYTCMQVAAAHWLGDEGFACGLVSYKGELVDKANTPATLFYKLRANLGLEDAVPERRYLTLGDGSEVLMPLKLPEWMLPAGFRRSKHSGEFALSNPERANFVTGYTTTAKTATGDRVTCLFNDEAAKFFAFKATWDGQSAVTDHRFAISSADLRYGPAFRDLAALGANADKDPTRAGPSYLRLEWQQHPEQDLAWREGMTARHADSPSALAREYDLDYEAGASSAIYREKAERVPVKRVEFRPSEMSLDWCVDPGVANQTAMHLVAYDPGLDQYALLESYANSGKPAEFYATIMLGTPLYVAYDYTEEDEAVMRVFRDLGQHIRYYVGDPAGNQRSSTTATSFYQELAASIARLSDGRRILAVQTKYDEGARSIAVRIEALRWLLGRMVIADTPRTRRTHAALLEHAFPAPPEHRPSLDREPLAPLRFWGHDRVTALEFYAVHRKLMGAATFARLPPVRQSMSGKVITSKQELAWTRR